MKPILIVLTGGPAGGKTEVKKAIAETFGKEVFVVDELATGVLPFFQTPNRQLAFTNAQNRNLQQSFLIMQGLLEDKISDAVEESTVKAVIFDRGMLDGAAYLEGGLAEFKKWLDVDLGEIYDRYVLILHLVSTAVFDPDLYERVRSSNPTRTESVDEAAERDFATRKAWNGHPNWKLIECRTGIEDLKNRVIEILREYIDTKHELKFRLKEMPKLPLSKVSLVSQGYLITDPQVEMRLRQVDRHCFLGIKGENLGSKGVSRYRWEMEIPQKAFEALWDQVQERVVEKTRHTIASGHYTIEVDVYHGKLEGLVVMEVSAAKPDFLDFFQMPSWALEQGVEEVTGDRRYSNRELAICQRIPG